MTPKLGQLCGTSVLLVLLSPHASLLAQETREIAVEWIYSDEGREPTKLPRFVWVEHGKAIFYDTRRAEEERLLEWLDPNTGTRTPAIDRDQALATLKSLREETVVEETIDSLLWPASVDRAGRYGVFVLDGDVFLLDLDASRFHRVTATVEVEKAVRFSPDGAWLSFVRENDLYVYDISAKAESRLTTDGSETLLNGTLSWVYWEEIFGRNDTGYWWSDDSDSIAFFHTDESPVSVMHYLDYEPAVPRVVTQRYPKAGGANPIVRLGVIHLDRDIDKHRTVWMDASEVPYEYLLRAKWLPDGRLSFQTMNRQQTRSDLYFMNAQTGSVEHILTETDEVTVNIHDDLHFLQGADQFIWSSERDGYTHLYRFTMEGALVNQVTKGSWSIRSSVSVFWVRQAVSAIDEEEGWIYFTALEKSAAERHLYRIRFDGSDMERLSHEDGTHRITFGPDSRYYFDVHSTSSTLPSLSLRRPNGALMTVLAPPRDELLSRFDMQYPEFLSIPAEDGFLMPAQILKPKDFNPTTRYPVILQVYGGPSAPTVSNSWNSWTYFDQVLLHNGFLVMRVDNRSATGISKDLENSVQGQLYSDSELNDLVAAVRWLKTQPYVNPERVGIWGWSGGGTYTLLAMTRSTEFKAGIAVAPVTDWRYYDTKFGEAYMGTPAANPDGFDQTSLVKRAKDLHGRLLLVHGTFDDNVHPQNSWHFIDELLDAGKPFDMMFYPRRKHGISDRSARIHLFKKMVEFWKAHL